MPKATGNKASTSKEGKAVENQSESSSNETSDIERISISKDRKVQKRKQVKSVESTPKTRSKRKKFLSEKEGDTFSSEDSDALSITAPEEFEIPEEEDSNNSANPDVNRDISDSESGIVNFGTPTGGSHKSAKRNLVDEYAETPVSDTNYVDKGELNQMFSKLDRDLESKVAKVCKKENEELMSTVLKAVNDMKQMMKGKIPTEAENVNTPVEDTMAVQSKDITPTRVVDSTLKEGVQSLVIAQESPSMSTVFTRVAVRESGKGGKRFDKRKDAYR